MKRSFRPVQRPFELDPLVHRTWGLAVIANLCLTLGMSVALANDSFAQKDSTLQKGHALGLSLLGYGILPTLNYERLWERPLRTTSLGGGLFYHPMLRGSNKGDYYTLYSLHARWMRSHGQRIAFEYGAGLTFTSGLEGAQTNPNSPIYRSERLFGMVEPGGLLVRAFVRRLLVRAYSLLAFTIKEYKAEWEAYSRKHPTRSLTAPYYNPVALWFGVEIGYVFGSRAQGEQ